MDDLDAAGMFGRELVEDLGRAVAAAVVDRDDVEVGIVLGQDLLDAPPNPWGLIPGRDQDGDRRRLRREWCWRHRRRGGG
jgi:hypothetical protein